MEHLLSADEAERVGLEFIRGKYYRGKVTIGEARLITEGAFPVYHLAGTIMNPSRSMMGRFISAEDTPYTFTMQVHAQEGSIITYQVR